MADLKLKKMLRGGGAVVNGWLSLPDSYAAEVMGRAGWDCLTIDMQHGAAGAESLPQMIAAAGAGGTPVMARAPWLEEGVIMRILDSGAAGVICPMVNSGEDARRFVNAGRYAPLGRRSFGPFRAAMVFGDDYHETANEKVTLLAMVETREAMENMDAIMSTPGLDGVYVGPSDLAMSMGFAPGFDQTRPEVVAAIADILAAAKKRGLVAGIHNGTAAYAKKMVEKGFQFVTIGSDARFIKAGAAGVLAEMKKDEGKAGGGY